MQRKIAFVAFLMIMCWSIAAFADVYDPVLKDNTLGAVYINSAKIFNMYLAQAEEIIKPENKDKLAEMEGQLKGYVPAEFKLSEFLGKLRAFSQTGVFLPDGPMWFSMDADLRPFLLIKAKIKPLEFYDFVHSFMDKAMPLPLKKEKDLLLFDVPISDFNLQLKIARDGIFLRSREETMPPVAAKQWQNLLGRAAGHKNLVAAEIDLHAVKAVIAKREQNDRYSVCFANLRVLTRALEMMEIDEPGKLKGFDQKLLLKKKYISRQLTCPDGGKYSINSTVAKEVYCSLHGSIKTPAKASVTDSTPAQLKPFETLRLDLSADLAELGIKLNDKKVIEQYLAIGRQQLQTIRHMAETQLGQLPEADKRQGIKMLDSVNLKADSEWLSVSVGGLDEKMMMSVMTGLVGTGAAIAAANFTKARNQAMSNGCAANRRALQSSTERFILDSKDSKDSKDGITSVTIEALIAGGYLRNAPVCPNHGVYNIKIEQNKPVVECSFHK